MRREVSEFVVCGQPDIDAMATRLGNVQLAKILADKLPEMPKGFQQEVVLLARVNRRAVVWVDAIVAGDLVLERSSGEKVLQATPGDYILMARMGKEKEHQVIGCYSAVHLIGRAFVLDGMPYAAFNTLEKRRPACWMMDGTSGNFSRNQLNTALTDYAVMIGIDGNQAYALTVDYPPAES